jgi:membrane protease YdiL (CAAX protease family)
MINSDKSFVSGWLQVLYLILIIAGGLTVFGSLSILVAFHCFGFETNSREYFYVVQSINSLGIFFIPALVFSFYVTKGWFTLSLANKSVSWKLICLVVVLSLFLLPVITILGNINEQIILPESMQKMEIWMREMEENSKMIIKLLTSNSTILLLMLNFFAMALLPAIFEEFLFRGTILPFFSKWVANKHIAIIVTAFIFSAIHLQFYSFIPRFLLGIYLGYLWFWGKSLWLPVFAHFLHNAISLILDYAEQQNWIDLDAYLAKFTDLVSRITVIFI